MGGPSDRTLSSVCLIVVLVAIPAGGAFASPIPPAADQREVGLGLEGLDGTVQLAPFDPRSPDLARRAPELADGLWSGRTDDGVLVRVAETPNGTVGVAVARDGGSWLVQQDGVLVETSGLEAARPVRLADDVVRDHGPSSGSGSGQPADGALQILLDADPAYRDRYGSGWARMQLAVVALVGAPYEAQLGIPLEVVAQHVHDDGALPPSARCGEALSDVRAYWETRRPVTSSPWEAVHLFSGRADRWTGALGCAYPRELDTDRAYAVTGTWWGGVPQPLLDAVVAGHELGHNFGGEHGRAFPHPDGPLGSPDCVGSPTTWMDTCAATDMPVFSDAPAGIDRVLDDHDLLEDGGNVRVMQAYASDRV